MSVNKIHHHVNCNRFLTVDSEQMTGLELMGSVIDKTNELIDVAEEQKKDYEEKINTLKNVKTDLTGDHKGSWHGVTKPEETSLGIQGQVRNNRLGIEKINNDMILKANTTDLNNIIIGMGNLSNEVKEAMTGGSVGVVADDSIVNSNIVNGQISESKLNSVLTSSIYSNNVISFKFKAQYVNNGVITPNDGTLKSTDLLFMKNSIKVTFKGDISNKQYKISYFNSAGTFLNDTGYLPCKEFVIEKGKYICLTFKSNPMISLNPNDFITSYLLEHKKERSVISPSKLLNISNILDGVMCHEGKNVTLNADLINYSVQGIMVDSAVGFVYEPVLVRDGLGLIYDKLFISKTNNSGARQIVEYDYFGTCIKTHSFSSSELDYELTLSNNCYYLVVIGYTNVQSKKDYKLHVGKYDIDWLNNTNNTLFDDIYKYPLYPAWGHEYLYSYYEKIHNNENIVICLDGDSTTEESVPPWTTTQGSRYHYVKKIMNTIGKYPLDKTTINKNGYGSRTTGSWCGAYHNIESDKVNFPNGTLDKTMTQNPDLIIFGYGINDASTNLFPNMSISEKLDQSKMWLVECLKRIRGNSPINGRPAYNKSADDVAIILCTPIMADNNLGKDREKWLKYYREMIKPLCREYNCAFYDVAGRHYDHAFSHKWSQSNTTQEVKTDGLHPLPACNGDFLSGMQDLLFPMCLWKW